MTHLKKKRDP